MNSHVEKALSESLHQYAAVLKADDSVILNRLITVFNQELHFLEKVNVFDEIFDDYPAFDELREVYFDLLMINFFTSDVKKLEEDYLDSKEWADIEDKTIDRGTELLNLLLYINECRDEQIRPGLEDFLKEFLLVEEDEFQDEFHIYEDLISNQQLAESSVEDICTNAARLDLTEEMENLFVPFMTFFFQPDFKGPVVQDLLNSSRNKGFDAAVYTLITNFNQK